MNVRCVVTSLDDQTPDVEKSDVLADHLNFSLICRISAQMAFH